MGKFVPTIRFRLAMAFGLPALLTLTLAVVSISALHQRPAVHQGVFDVSWLVAAIAGLIIAMLTAAYFH